MIGEHHGTVLEFILLTDNNCVTVLFLFFSYCLKYYDPAKAGNKDVSILTSHLLKFDDFFLLTNFCCHARTVIMSTGWTNLRLFYWRVNRLRQSKLSYSVV